MATSKRQQLEQWTTIVADTGNLAAVKALKPMDATTNPSLLLAVAKSDIGPALLAQAITIAKKYSQHLDARLLCDAFTVVAGSHLLNTVPGLVSTEVDAQLSFNIRATIERARRLMALYRLINADTERVLIKIAATWEGIQAAKALEAEGIRTNLTLVFHPAQAVAAAQAQGTLISPFVGRIYDWYKNRNDDVSQTDPGVNAVKDIYQRLKAMGSNTIIMGASFRSLAQIEALAGCDRLTISPELLEQLATESGQLERQLIPVAGKVIEPLLLESEFRFLLNQCAMSSDLLSDGIRRFVNDQKALETLVLQPAAAA